MHFPDCCFNTDMKSCLHLYLLHFLTLVPFGVIKRNIFVYNTNVFLFTGESTLKKLMCSWCSLLSLNVLTNVLKAKGGIQSHPWKKCLQPKTSSLSVASCLQLPLTRISGSQFKNLDKFPQSQFQKTSHNKLLALTRNEQRSLNHHQQNHKASLPSWTW